jgi:hypothetical protein
MTGRTQGDQVQLGISSTSITELLMMNFQVRHRAAGLTSPAIASKHLLVQFLLAFGLEAQPWLFHSNAGHEALRQDSLRNVCFCVSGSNPRNLFIEKSGVSGSPLPRLAPAKKSAQIISKQ